MRKISVCIDDTTNQKLIELVKINDCTLSDIVNSAIIAFSMDSQPVMFVHKSKYDELVERIGDVDRWCYARGIDKARLRYLVNSVENGHSITGSGNTKNRFRDKNDDRLFKTHTSWIAHCLKEDYNIDLEGT